MGDVHSFFEYEPNKPGRVIVREMTQRVCNAYLNNNHSITKLRKLNRFTINCLDPSNSRTWVSNGISYDIIQNYLQKNNKFDHQAFNLYELRCNWLDGSVELSLPQQIVGSDEKAVSFRLPLPFGDTFPLWPTLDREGVLYNSFQNSLAKRIISLHHRLVTSSHEFETHDWLYDLIALISNCVSLVDITLNQFHIKAEYDPLPGWQFDKSRVGSRVCRRIRDKLHWIKEITGSSPDNIAREMKALIFFKNLRNHTQHFDPPCFGFSLEDASSWLNMVSDIGSLLCKLRQKIGSSLNEQIIELMLLPKVIFNGKVTHNRERVAQLNSGYITTCWANPDDDIKD